MLEAARETNEENDLDVQFITETKRIHQLRILDPHADHP
jgi:hypothetical protein